MAGSVLEFTDGNFEQEVIQSEQPVLVDFWAPWCGPCRTIAPTIEELASDFEGQVRVGKVNTDENPQTASAQQISAIPTVMLFKGGEIVDKFVGVISKEQFATSINKNL